MTIISSVKSKFAKFVDATLGACLIFFAATAVLRYYTTLELAAVSGFAVAACACLLLHVSGANKRNATLLSSAADDMFYELMFKDERAHAKLLYDGLKTKSDKTRLHGKTVYLGKTAAVCMFDRAPTANDVARIIARAKHYGAEKAVVLCKIAPAERVNIDGFSVEYAVGNDVYKLFGSLGCLPQKKYSVKKKGRAFGLSSALGKDKILRYLLLSVALFFVATFGGLKIIPLVCACVSATLCVTATILNIVRSAEKHTEHSGERSDA